MNRDEESNLLFKVALAKNLMEKAVEEKHYDNVLRIVNTLNLQEARAMLAAVCINYYGSEEEADRG